MRKKLSALALGLMLPGVVWAAEVDRLQVTGEIIDTWCYYSGVMGGPEAVVGTAHHTCALWCSAGGIPVGLRADDGTVYMVLKLEDDPQLAGGDTALRLASNTVLADGIVHRRDGINYMIVEKVVQDMGIINLNHEDYGPVPPFAIPEPKE
ncbi:MAG: hypothetical protein AB3N13_11720 [Arenibacterium sp.]